MSRPLVSIVISSFNYERYLAFAIESALTQTYQNIEVVVVDDGSTDGSPAVIAGYGDRIRSVFQPNQGITGACNTGFAASRGDIVVFLDADDLLYAAAVEDIVGAFAPSAIKVQFRLEIIDRDGHSKGVAFPNFPTDYGPRALRDEFMATGNYLWPMTSGNAYARCFLDKLLPLPVDRFPFAPDGAINSVAPLFGDIVTFPRPLGCYRIHGSNHWALSTVVPSRFGDYIKQKEKEMAFLRQHADARGVALPAANLLDFLPVYVEYRLCALKLRQSISGDKTDSAVRLCCLSARHAVTSKESMRRRLFILLWSIALALSSGRLALKIIEFRYDEAARPELLNKALGWLRARNKHRFT